MASANVTIFLIADLAGYTSLMDAHGADVAAAVVTRFRTLAERAALPGARIVEQVGDQLLIAGQDAAAIVTTAIRLRDALEVEPRFPGLRSGIDGGAAVERDGHYFGPALNLAARFAAHAEPDRSSAAGPSSNDAGPSRASRSERSVWSGSETSRHRSRCSR